MRAATLSSALPAATPARRSPARGGVALAMRSLRSQKTQEWTPIVVRYGMGPRLRADYAGWLFASQAWAGRALALRGGDAVAMVHAMPSDAFFPASPVPTLPRLAP